MSKKYSLHLLQEKMIGDQWKGTPKADWDFKNNLSLKIDQLDFQAKWHGEPSPKLIDEILETDKAHHGEKIRDLRWVKVNIEIINE